MSKSIADDLSKTLRQLTSGWKREKRHADRNDHVSYHSLARMRIGRERPIIRDIAFSVMEQAYNHASDNGKYYANARQIMYQARPLMLRKEPSLSLDGKFSVYFTQTILKDYLEWEQPDGWKVVWDARGHLIEPHTGKVIGLGGIEVEEYLRDWTDGGFDECPEADFIEGQIATHGPANRFNAALFIEKEGFTEILKDAGIEKRFDIAVMSTKGLPVKAGCDLVQEFERRGVATYVVHDFDFAGFKIVKTWREGTRLAEGSNVIELGLRLEDIEGLDSEPVEYNQRKDPREYLRECGATDEECEFLVERAIRGGWIGRRVELNAMTSSQLIAWLERKLEEHGVKKVVPTNGTLVSAYRRAKYLQELEQQIEDWKEEYKNGHRPKELRARVEKILKENPETSWDEAIWTCAHEDSTSERDEDGGVEK